MSAKIHTSQISIEQKLFTTSITKTQLVCNVCVSRMPVLFNKAIAVLQKIFIHIIDLFVVQKAFEIEWDSISNTPVLNNNSVDEWNTFFDLPTNGSVFRAVIISGNTIKLYGGSNISISNNRFSSNSHIVNVNDYAECIISCGSASFSECAFLEIVNLPAAKTFGIQCFSNCQYSLSVILLPSATSLGMACLANVRQLNTLYIPKCTDLGGGIGTNFVFYGIIGNTITLTIPSSLMISNGGSPDGDIASLIANNNVTIIQV